MVANIIVYHLTMQHSGAQPAVLMWARNGRGLFYRNGDKMMVTAVETKPTFIAAKPKLLFRGHYETAMYDFEPNYDCQHGRAAVSDDQGKRAGIGGDANQRSAELV